MMLLPPLMSTPRIGGLPEGTFPAPPEPFDGEIPPCAFGSAPCPAPLFAAPLPEPFMALPGPSPYPMLVPPFAPPKPDLSPPEGDIASDPVLPLMGSPSLVPGWLEITVPASLPLPPLFGGVSPEPASRGAPSPVPRRPRPEPVALEPPLTAGGGGTTFSASILPPEVPAAPPVLPAPPPFPASAGGGAITLGFPR